ncbi:MAG: sulfotransferase [Desulfobacteraceae bacterium]|jgi:hypothetical protein
MQNNLETPDPVVIGGVGGSGTRVVAEIISHLGFYLGCDLNPANDNQWFMLLFKRPKWHQKACQNKDEVFRGLQILSNAMTSRNTPGLADLTFVLRAVLEIALEGHNHLGDGRGIWPFVRAWKMLATKERMRTSHMGWGWKEPNSHIYLDVMAEYFEGFKYIHTMRHGLDMAFSRNQQQLYNWGPLFGVELPKSKSDEPKASLRYWIKSNQRVFEIGRTLGNQKFLVVNFEKMCALAKSEIERIVSFLDIRPNAEGLEGVFAIPKKPESLGRYKSRDLNQFDAADLEVLESFGYSIR